MRHIRYPYQFRHSALQVLVKASPLGACLSLFGGSGRRRASGFLFALVMLLSLVSATGAALFPARALALTPPTNQADCQALSGTWINNDHVHNLCTLPPIANMSLEQQVQSYVYYYTLGNCLANGALNDGSLFGGGVHHRINVADITSGHWFAGSNQQGGGYLDGVNGIKTTPDGSNQAGTQIDCGQPALVNGALSLWNNWAPDEALCAFGYVRASGPTTRCTNAQGGTDEFQKGNNVESTFKAAVNARIYGGKTPSLTDAAKYLLYLKAFQQACIPNATASATPPTGSAKNDYAVRIVSGDGKAAVATTVYYTDYRNKDTSIPVYLYPNIYMSGSGDQQTCGSLVAAINGKNGKNGLADAYASDLQSTGNSNAAGGGNKQCQDGAATDANGNPCQTTATSCNIDQIGWLLCPILTTGAHLADSAYGFLADNFLATNPSLLNTDPKATTTDDSGNTVAVGTGTYTAWKIMLTIANVAFIIAFLIVIFSQLTSVGVTNYGVKKLLPRLIVVAILVNVSFWVCAIAVDVSNILGYSLKDVLTSVADQVATSGGGTAVNTGDQSGNLFGIVTTIITVGSIAWVNLGAVVVAIVGALITLLIIFVLLAARQALIVLLVVIAPLAFVAYLLPNTESLFKKWRTMFTSLLLLFPIIGVLYGACLLASEILKQVAGSNVIMQIMAYVALVIPLIAIIPLLKGSLDGVGKIGANIQSLGSKARGAAGKKTQKTFDNSRLGQYRGYRSNRWGQRRAAIQGGTFQGRGGKANPLNWLSAANRGANSIGGRFGAKLTNQGAGVASKEDAELLGNAGSRLETMSLEGKPLSQDQLIQIAKRQDVTHDGTASGRVLAGARSFDEYSRRAAIERAGKTATVAQAHDLVDASGGMSVAERKALAGSLVGSNAAGKAPYLGGRTLADIAQGTANSDNAALAAIQTGKITAEALAGGDKDSVAKLVDVATKTPAGSRERAALQAAYAELSKPDSRLREHIVAGGAHDVALQAIRSL
jgi:hypothetical protein